MVLYFNINIKDSWYLPSSCNCLAFFNDCSISKSLSLSWWFSFSSNALLTSWISISCLCSPILAKLPAILNSNNFFISAICSSTLLLLSSTPSNCFAIIWPRILFLRWIVATVVLISVTSPPTSSTLVATFLTSLWISIVFFATKTFNTAKYFWISSI